MTGAVSDSVLAALPRQDPVTARLSLLEGEPCAIPARGLTEKTCKVPEGDLPGATCSGCLLSRR